MRVGFTGTRDGLTPPQTVRLTEVVTFLRGCGTAFHHGDCIGADAQAVALVRGYAPDWRIISHPCNLEDQRAHTLADEYRDVKAPLVRNRDIVDETSIMIATPRQTVPQWRGSGTWATMRYTVRASKPLMIIWPDGSVLVERLSDLQRWLLDSIVGA